MSTATIEKAPTPKLSRVPPDEQFWKHYSPHGEAPLSLAGAITLHILGLGVLILCGVYLARMFFPTTQSLPVEPVRMALGGGGGKKSGVGNAPGVGQGPEDVGERDPELDQTGEKEAPRRPALNQIEKQQNQEKFAPADARFLNETPSESAKAFTRLDDNVRKRLTDGLNPGRGKGGTGSGGGQGTGAGTGDGGGSGSGKLTLNKREKRMLRWHMQFTANSGPEYLAQLRGLGAILAFPVGEGPDAAFKVVHNLRPGQAKLQDEDVTKINRIFWIDDKPRSVEDILGALQLRLPVMPNRFVAFMPEKLEEQLFQMERRYVERILRQPFNEDKIGETIFRAVPTPSGFKAELVRVTMKD